MPSIMFRRKAKEDLRRLLNYWREIELSVKQAEQVEKRVVIPAINELRYGARQLYTGMLLYSKHCLSEHDQTTITRRLWVAEQYFMNADHDVADAVVKYVSDITDSLDFEIGESDVAIFFPDYPAFKRHIAACFMLIAEARHDYDKRMTNYNTVKNVHLPFLINELSNLKTAEVRARHAKSRNERDLVKAKRTIGIQAWFTYITGAATLLSIPLSIYLWTYAYPDFCKANRNKAAVFTALCGPETPRAE